MTTMLAFLAVTILVIILYRIITVGHTKADENRQIYDREYYKMDKEK